MSISSTYRKKKLGSDPFGAKAKTTKDTFGADTTGNTVMPSGDSTSGPTFTSATGETKPVGGASAGDQLTAQQRYRRTLRQGLGVSDIRQASGGALSRIYRAGLVGGQPDTVGSEDTNARIRRARRRYD